MLTLRRQNIMWLGISSLLLAMLMGRAVAGEPQERLRETVDAVFAILADETLRVPEKTEARREKLRQAILQRFGFDEMARRSLGQHWQSLALEQQQEFVALFSQLLEQAYIKKLERYQTDTQISYAEEVLDGNGSALVRSHIVGDHDTTYEVAYRLLPRNGQWEVYDIVIEGVSLLDNYQTQFDKVIVQQSYDALVKKLRLKWAQEEAAVVPAN